VLYSTYGTHTNTTQRAGSYTAEGLGSGLRAHANEFSREGGRRLGARLLRFRNLSSLTQEVDLCTCSRHSVLLSPLSLVPALTPPPRAMKKPRMCAGVRLCVYPTVV
jgi:hypothetical protein